MIYVVADEISNYASDNQILISDFIKANGETKGRINWMSLK